MSRKPHICLLGGCQRSGTTLVQTVLENALPDCTRLAECHVVCDLLQSYSKRKNEWSKTGDFFSSLARFQEFYRGSFDRLIEGLQELHGPKSSIVLKDPHFSRVLPAIADIVPGAVACLVVRDPRDIVASFVRIGQRQIGLGRETHYTRRDMSLVCNKITDAYDPFVKNADELQHVFVCKYEDVCENAEAVVDRLFESIGIEQVPPTGPLLWNRQEKRHTNQDWVGELEGQEPNESHVGDFHSVLTEQEIAFVEEKCAHVLKHFGYPQFDAGIELGDSNDPENSVR